VFAFRRPLQGGEAPCAREDARRDPKFIGFGTDFHIVRLDKAGQRIKGCEEWFTQLPQICAASARKGEPLVL
jgi:hypothetical protein